MPYKDPKKRRACRRKWYSEHKKSEIAYVRRRRREIRKWFEEYRSKLKCSKCKENHSATLEFHHKTGKDKEANVTYMSHYGYSIERIEKEIKKCIVLCANCHRKEHYKQNKNI